MTVVEPATSPGASVTHTEDRRQMLRFTLCEALYAMPIEPIREILQVGRMTKVPMMPAFVKGVMNLRGAVVPVLDLGARLGLHGTAIGRRTCIVIVESPLNDGSMQRHGVLVDAVHEVLEVDPSQINAVPALGSRVAPHFISGVVRVKSQSVELLDVGRVFDDQELGQLIASPTEPTLWLH
ncbi:chemotaxis protein CheW [Aquabacterium sp. A3]|uniref:chemotaxis protein CheW n=1 Tax=Aquabacterium sp. A3 TaxID=3132829 RepID=UPI0031193300